MIINCFIYNLNYSLNIGEIIRTSHVLAGKSGKLYFYDPNGVFKNNKEEINKFSCNIDSLKEFELISNPIKFLDSYKGRIIGTDMSSKSKSLTEFKFKDKDLIIFGNERVGIPNEILNICDDYLIIPMNGSPYIKKDYHKGKEIKGVGEYPTLKTSIAHAIILYNALEQAEKFKNFNFRKYKKWHFTH